MIKGKHLYSKSLKKQWQLYLIMLLPVASIIVFSYIPMYGVLLAFKDYSLSKGIINSPFVGLKYINMFLTLPSFYTIVKNTVFLSLYSLIAEFPFPIILAIAVDQMSRKWLKKTVQTITYAPYFISTVVLVAILLQFLSPRTGLVNLIVTALGGQDLNYIAYPNYFAHIYVWSGIWQFTGFNAIIFIAALTTVDLEQREAATIDGASRIQRIWHVDMPAIAPTIMILLILRLGRIMTVGFEKVYLMQNDMNIAASQILSTYVYKIGLINMNYSFSTAVNLFNSVINCILIVGANHIIKKLHQPALY
jgi:putative aldouronate transport system permease protein